jgi:uncharacterized membrane protein YwaF
MFVNRKEKIFEKSFFFSVIIKLLALLHEDVWKCDETIFLKNLIFFLLKFNMICIFLIVLIY